MVVGRKNVMLSWRLQENLISLSILFPSILQPNIMLSYSSYLDDILVIISHLSMIEICFQGEMKYSNIYGSPNMVGQNTQWVLPITQFYIWYIFVHQGQTKVWIVQ